MALERVIPPVGAVRSNVNVGTTAISFVNNLHHAVQGMGVYAEQTAVTESPYEWPGEVSAPATDA